MSGKLGRRGSAGCGEAPAEAMEVLADVGVQTDELTIEQNLAAVEGDGDRRQVGD